MWLAGVLLLQLGQSCPKTTVDKFLLRERELMTSLIPTVANAMLVLPKERMDAQSQRGA